MLDAPLRDQTGRDIYLSEAFAAGGRGFTLVEYANGVRAEMSSDLARITIGDNGDMLRDATGAFAARYDCTPGSAYLLRPDGYVAARFKQPNGAQIADALRRASGWQ